MNQNSTSGSLLNVPAVNPPHSPQNRISALLDGVLGSGSGIAVSDIPKRDWLDRRYALHRREGDWFLRFTEKFSLESSIGCVLDALGLREVAARECEKLEISNIRWRFSGLPFGFGGFRILHLSDLHADLFHGFGRMVASAVESIDVDAWVITGDFKNIPEHPSDVVEKELRDLFSVARCPIYACPGNHDSISTLDAAARAGATILANDVAVFKIKEASIFFCGVDDPHYYKLHKLGKVAGPGFRILLAHSPEIAFEASRFNFALCLCGHTHGGQICLPGGFPLIRRAPIPLNLVKGSWQVNNLMGYTSRGTGSASVKARLFCRPEATIHTFFH